MDDGREAKKENIEFAPSKAFRDLAVLFIATFLVVVLSYFFGIFEAIVRFFQEYPQYIIYVDEVIAGLLIFSIGSALFAWRRWAELKNETAKRIKKQEELLRVSATQAQIERIISKQLRCDMDQMKEDVREIRRVLLNKNKNIAS